MTSKSISIDANFPGGNIVVDPMLCHLDVADASVAENSPALTNPAGIIIENRIKI